MCPRHAPRSQRNDTDSATSAPGCPGSSADITSCSRRTQSVSGCMLLHRTSLSRRSLKRMREERGSVRSRAHSSQDVVVERCGGDGEGVGAQLLAPGPELFIPVNRPQHIDVDPPPPGDVAPIEDLRKPKEHWSSSSFEGGRRGERSGRAAGGRAWYVGAAPGPGCGHQPDTCERCRRGGSSSEDGKYPRRSGPGSAVRSAGVSLGTSQTPAPPGGVSAGAGAAAALLMHRPVVWPPTSS